VVERTDPEVVEPLSADDARTLTDQIKTAAADLWSLVTRAYQGQAWKALGFDSWDAYMEDLKRDVPLALPREKRKETVCSLRDHGLSMRAIASATGTGTRQVQEDLAQREVCSETTPKTPVVGKDGKRYAAKKAPAKKAPAKKAAKKAPARPQRKVPYGNGWMVGRFDFDGGDTPDTPETADTMDGGVMPGAFDIEAFIDALSG